MGLINEIGNVYGYLTVLERDSNDRDGHARWKCQCKCGQITTVLGKHLRSGNTQSCGCYQRERAAQGNMDRVESLIGKRFGKLQVISEAGFITGSNGKRRRTYNCLCDCGNYCIVQHQYLTYGDTASCGCIRSKGEVQIRQLLEGFHIDFKQEFSFPDLVDGCVLRFDFAIFKDNKLVGLIEHQGEQHIYANNGWYSEDLIRHDKMKQEYCLQHNIPLVIIFYKRGYNIQIEDLQLERIFNDTNI